jgi:hypothetical protein
MILTRSSSDGQTGILPPKEIFSSSQAYKPQPHAYLVILESAYFPIGISPEIFLVAGDSAGALDDCGVVSGGESYRQQKGEGKT